MRIKHLHITKKKHHTHTKKIIKIWGRNETAFGNHTVRGGDTPLQPTTRGTLYYML